ncbi:hypothetical protein B0H13DRAFT_2338898 [Mycena leptocephala]|nr:hypothetical protein B0H13DRAFT_2338898 [Mycena leptocephala]
MQLPSLARQQSPPSPFRSPPSAHAHNKRLDPAHANLRLGGGASVPQHRRTRPSYRHVTNAQMQGDKHGASTSLSRSARLPSKRGSCIHINTNAEQTSPLLAACTALGMYSDVLDPGSSSRRGLAYVAHKAGEDAFAPLVSAPVFIVDGRLPWALGSALYSTAALSPHLHPTRPPHPPCRSSVFDLNIRAVAAGGDPGATAPDAGRLRVVKSAGGGGCGASLPRSPSLRLRSPCWSPSVPAPAPSPSSRTRPLATRDPRKVVRYNLSPLHHIDASSTHRHPHLAEPISYTGEIY